MENDRRKKKTKKKKKSNQAPTLTESATNDGRESTSDTRSHDVEVEQGEDVQFSGVKDASNDVGRIIDSDTDGHQSNGIEDTTLAKADKQFWIDREASFEEKLKQLQAEKDAQMQKEAILEYRIKDLLREKDEYLQNLADQEESIRHLHSEKIAFIQKEDMLEERCKQLQMEKDAYLQKEISTEEAIAALRNDSKILRAQVMELEESRKILVEEKQELMEKVSILQLKINNLESTITYSHPNMNEIVTPEDGNAEHQREDMHPPAAKMVPENPKLVEKVNGAYADSLPVGSNLRDIAVVDGGDNSLAFAQDFVIGGEGDKMVMPESHSTRSLEGVMNFERNGEDGSGPPKSSGDIVEADEIVPIPLVGNQTEDARFEVYEKNDASFVDAPLIGAPFRFISFVAKYVSGADLVNKNAEDSV
ncbi:hypothetical protein F511_22803 [Dorcoceras hygrometricum]|uniref:Uncharacterized protein n=1 Tax=Dorcoceras hygrometricum TaxID=472368 RepID=A0A2Z7C1T9_9LAMI|nr:hypothetical protein F511_22803 [Dorcoceras hygrometricum]